MPGDRSAATAISRMPAAATPRARKTPAAARRMATRRATALDLARAAPAVDAFEPPFEE